MQSCLDELKREFLKFGNIDHKSLSEDVLVIQAALLKSFRTKLREQVGSVEFNFIG
jgi:gluconate kinase